MPCPPHLAHLTPVQLGNSGDAAAVPCLVRQMRSEKTNDRRLAASAVRKLAAQHRTECLEAVPALFELLSDDGAQVRQYALKALAAIKPEATPKQVAAVQSVEANDPKPSNRKEATKTLAALSAWPPAAPPPSAKPAPPGGHWAQRLARHFHACIEAADRRALRLNWRWAGSQFVSATGNAKR